MERDGRSHAMLLSNTEFKATCWSNFSTSTMALPGNPEAECVDVTEYKIVANLEAVCSGELRPTSSHVTEYLPRRGTAN